MTTREQLIRARLGILAMAAELRNTAKACKLAGVSRSQFYAMRKAYELYGKEGLAPRVRRKPEMPNRTPVQLEEQILLQTRRYPRISYVRLAGEMRSEGGNVTPTMVRYVWQRHGLSTQSARRAWARLLKSQSKQQVAEVDLTDQTNQPLESDACQLLAAPLVERPSVDGR